MLGWAAATDLVADSVGDLWVCCCGTPDLPLCVRAWGHDKLSQAIMELTSTYGSQDWEEARLDQSAVPTARCKSQD